MWGASEGAWRNAVAGRVRAAAGFAAEAAAETLWPTRCALCDLPGAVLCARCARELPFVDWWRACRRCGAPFGLVQCPACSEPALGRLGRTGWPFSGCASAVEFSEEAGQLVRVFKDQGEQRLARDLASMMARSLPRCWDLDAVTFVPATLSAARYRGFDHAELVAGELAVRMGLPCRPLLARPRTRDQRSLGAAQRIANLADSFSPRAGTDPACCAGARLLLVDDVFTTGATLCAATDALLRAGAGDVRCATFARV